MVQQGEFAPKGKQATETPNFAPSTSASCYDDVPSARNMQHIKHAVMYARATVRTLRFHGSMKHIAEPPGTASPPSPSRELQAKPGSAERSHTSGQQIQRVYKDGANQGTQMPINFTFGVSNHGDHTTLDTHCRCYRLNLNCISNFPLLVPRPPSSDPPDRDRDLTVGVGGRGNAKKGTIQVIEMH
eukprot:4401895-Pyramimonas_sp.AAC.1